MTKQIQSEQENNQNNEDFAKVFYSISIRFDYEDLFYDLDS